MAVTKRPVRLSKAAREFNISLDSIVEFLAGKGYEVDRSPNFKLDSEMYDCITDEFHDEKAVKEVASTKGLEYLGKETISIGDVKKEDKRQIDDFIDSEIYITDIAVGYSSEKPVIEPKKETVKEKAEEPVAEEKIEEKAAEKINLNQRRRKKINQVLKLSEKLTLTA